MNPVDKILDIARWSPSGDNTQPWRFERVSERHFVVHGFDTREHSVYDLDGRISQIALGALLETIEIAAAEQGQKVRFERRSDMPESKPTFDVFLDRDDATLNSPLFPYIPLRTTQRRSMSPRPLTPVEKQQLEEAIAPLGCRIVWLGTWRDKIKIPRLLFKKTSIRLRMPETYEVHKSIIEWNAGYSEDKIPDKALGLDPITLRLMKWIMKSWRRVEFFNRFLAGTVLPGIELDWLPGLFCGSYFVILTEQPPRTSDDYIQAGRGVQRFWLTATKLALQMQPEMATLVFSRYVRDGRIFTRVDKIQADAEEFSGQLTRLIGEETVRHAVFMGRIGEGKAAKARSIRRPLRELTDKN